MKNKTIYLSPQIEHFKNKVDDRSIKVGGGQHTNTLDDCKFHVSIRKVLTYAPLLPRTDSEWEKLNHMMLTSDEDWDQKVLDCEIQVDNETWFDT